MQYNPKRMFELVEKKIKKSARLVLERSIKKNINPRTVALGIAQAKVKLRMKN